MKINTLVLLVVVLTCLVATKFGQSSMVLFSCTTKIVSALTGVCQKNLLERLEAVDTAESDMNASAPSLFRCCYYAEFVHCVTEEARPECGDNVSNVVEKQISERFQNFSKNCRDKSYYSPACIFVVWFNFIVIASIVLGILLIGCCIGFWCCR